MQSARKPGCSCEVEPLEDRRHDPSHVELSACDGMSRRAAVIGQCPLPFAHNGRVLHYL